MLIVILGKSALYWRRKNSVLNVYTQLDIGEVDVIA